MPVRASALPRTPLLCAVLLSACGASAGGERPVPTMDADVVRSNAAEVGPPADAFDGDVVPVADLLRVALDRSPRIAAARARADAAAARADAAGWLPDPKLTLGWYATEVETRVGPQDWAVGVQQAIPFPTKLALRRDAAAVRARRAGMAYQRVVRDVLVEVVKTAHDLEYVDRALAITDDLAAVLDRYVAQAAAPDASPLAAELFRAETQRAQLENDRVLLLELRTVRRRHLASLLALPTAALPDLVHAGQLPRVQADFDALVELAGRHNHELAEAGLALDEARVQARLAEQTRLPDLSLGVTRIDTDRLDGSLGLDPGDNGKDPVVVQLGATLPLWVGRDAATIRAGRADERAAALERADQAERVRDRLARAWFDLRNAERLEELYRETLLPRAEVAARTAEDLLEAGKGTFGGLLETVAVLHDFRLAAARARADRGRALAELERVLGRPFDGSTPAPVPGKDTP